MAVTVSASADSSTEITITISGLTRVTWARYGYVMYGTRSSNLSNYEEFTIAGTSATGTMTKYVTISGLSPGTRYYFQVDIYKTSDDSLLYTSSIVNATTDDEGGGDEWYLNTLSFGQISSETSRAIRLYEYDLYRISVSFANAGTATFYSSGSTDTRAWLGTSTGWNSYNGQPTSYLTSDDDGGSGTNFQITYDVSANTTYYLWVRGFDEYVSGSTTVYITPPAGSTVTFTVTNVTETTVTCVVRGMSAASFARRLYWYYGTTSSASNSAGYTNVAASSTAPGDVSITFGLSTGLKPSTRYYFRVEFYRTSDLNTPLRDSITISATTLGISDGIYIYDGGWDLYIPYIHNGSSWIEYAACLYDGGWIEG